MKIKNLSTMVLSLAAPLILTLTAHASSLVTWTFYNIAADGSTLNSPLTPVSSPGGYTITLSAIENYTTGAAGLFYDKNEGNTTDEQGLGVIPTTGNVPPGTTEVDSYVSSEAIKIDLPTGLTDFNLFFKSLAGNEYADIWSGAIGTGTLIGHITHDTSQPVAIPESFAIDNQYLGSPIFVTAYSNDFLLYGADATSPVPEPATLVLFGLGLAGLGGMKRKRNQKTGEDKTLEIPR